MHTNLRRGLRLVVLALFSLTAARFSFALHIVPDHPGDYHFTAGPCPKIVPKDGATCPNAAATCPAFYNPALLPAGYDSVSYCAEVPAGVGFQSPGFTLLTMPLNAQEQRAFLIAAKKAESFVKDDVTVVIEPYKIAYLDADGNNFVFFGGNEYWNPVCGADALLPPYGPEASTILANPDGSYSYQDLPETYTIVLEALKTKNARNRTPMKLIDYLPTQQQIGVEWPSTFFGWRQDTNYLGDSVSNFLVGTSGDFPIPPEAKPFTLCGSPAVMKMLGLAPLFLQNGHCIDDINSPAENMNVTLEGTDGALVIPDVTAYPPVNTIRPWLYDATQPSVAKTQLPKAFFEKTYNSHLPDVSCGDPSQCRFPSGVDPGADLVGTMSHEINHILGVMQSQYYKVRGEATSLVHTYGTALYLLDLFDLDSDAVVDGFGYPGIHAYGDFTLAPRNNDSYEPTTVYIAPTPSDLTPWVQFGSRDHVMVYDVIGGAARYFPLMNYPGLQDPDGDIQQQFGLVDAPNPGNLFFVDPELANMPSMNVVHGNVQAGSMRSTISVDTIREYSELAAQGWDVKYSTLSPSTYTTLSPLAKWYQACFDANGALTTAKNANCKFSVLPADLKAIR
jgi:hypothetical protein